MVDLEKGFGVVEAVTICMIHVYDTSCTAIQGHISCRASSDEDETPRIGPIAVVLYRKPHICTYCRYCAVTVNRRAGHLATQLLVSRPFDFCCYLPYPNMLCS